MTEPETHEPIAEHGSFSVMFADDERISIDVPTYTMFADCPDRRQVQGSLVTISQLEDGLFIEVTDDRGQVASTLAVPFEMLRSRPKLELAR